MPSSRGGGVGGGLSAYDVSPASLALPGLYVFHDTDARGECIVGEGASNASVGPGECEGI